MGELKRECREDLLKTAPVLEIPRAEKAGAELSVRKARLGERLCNGRFSCPGWTTQPENAAVPFIC